MAATAFVRARIDETLKNEAAAVLAGTPPFGIPFGHGHTHF